jgi:hypothetical protein
VTRSGFFTTLAGEYCAGHDMDGVRSMLKTGIIDIHDRRIDLLARSEMRIALFDDIEVFFDRTRHQSRLGHAMPAEIDTARTAVWNHTVSSEPGKLHKLDRNVKFDIDFESLACQSADRDAAIRGSTPKPPDRRT